jgi:hypothetical protein
MVGVLPETTGEMRFEASIGWEKRIVTLRAAQVAVNRFIAKRRS